MKKFNISGPCVSDEHYIINMEGKIARITKYIYDSNFIYIDNPPKCGKTTFLTALEKSLREKYSVISINMNQFSPADLKSVKKFCKEFIRQTAESLLRAKSDIISFTESEKIYLMKWDNKIIYVFVIPFHQINFF